MVHKTSDVQSLQLNLETLASGVIGRAEHDQYRVKSYIRVPRIAGHGMNRVLDVVLLGTGDLSIPKGSDIRCESLGLSPALERVHLLCRSGPAHAKCIIESFHVLIWIRTLSGDPRRILRLRNELRRYG
jgi:hypothetical protein